MASNITLTSSMRSNLSSLKSLACQMSTTQTRLSTGKRVNSAIDNASSYYQARALSNRSSDLDMLLDAMGQSIQTITAAVQGLEASGEMLENAAVIAQNAYETAIIPEKAWFEAQVGPNGAVVTTAQELRDAIAANKKTICVYGKIDLGEITTGLTLQNNQKLVGIGYFGDFDTEIDKFSSIKATTTKGISMIITGNNNIISDLSLNFEWTTNSTAGKGAIQAVGNDVTLCNIDVKDKLNWTGASGVTHYTYDVHLSANNTNTTFQGINNIGGVWGIWIYNKGSTIFDEGSRNTISNVTFQMTEDNSLTVIKKGGMLYSKSFSSYGSGGSDEDEISIRVENGAKWKTDTEFYFGVFKGNRITNILEEGSELAIGDSYYKLNQEYQFSGKKQITNNNISNYMDVVTTEPWAELQEHNDEEILRSQETIAKDLAQYTEMMTAFDELVSDAGYQGVNLLADGHIDVMFNETRTHSYNVQGKDMSSAGIGITTREWVTKDDIAQSIKEIQNAMNSVRDMVETLGNHLSIIQTRMDFTDAMTDILQTGADDLVLADMNEESANYLALQTRNSLAVNALALAAQSNNSVLKLF